MTGRWSWGRFQPVHCPPGRSLAEVTEVEIEHGGEVLYVDLVFQDGEMLDAVCVEHLEPVDPKVRVFAARAA